MAYKEDDLLPISALQHFLFCPRQCALIHIEQVWTENVLTAQGRVMHEHAHEEKFECRDGVRIERGVGLRSLRLGLIGKADVVEFHRDAAQKKWQPFPVEYKHGKPKENNCDKVQLCGQAMCLEEMLKAAIPGGAIFYGKTRHRLDVDFDEALRRETAEAAARLHEFIRAGKTPAPQYHLACESCSLADVCMPRKMSRCKSVKDYLRTAINLETNDYEKTG